MKKLISITLILILNSCIPFKENGIDFEIENNSDSAIEHVKFTTSENLTFMEFDKIEPNKSVGDFLSMKNNKSDGSYVLEFTRPNGKKELLVYGYYTNGGALDRWVEYEIKNDIVTWKFSGTGY